MWHMCSNLFLPDDFFDFASTKRGTRLGGFDGSSLFAEISRTNFIVQWRGGDRAQNTSFLKGSSQKQGRHQLLWCNSILYFDWFWLYKWCRYYHTHIDHIMFHHAICCISCFLFARSFLKIPRQVKLEYVHRFEGGLWRALPTSPPLLTNTFEELSLTSIIVILCHLCTLYSTSLLCVWFSFACPFFFAARCEFKRELRTFSWPLLPRLVGFGL